VLACKIGLLSAPEAEKRDGYFAVAKPFAGRGFSSGARDRSLSGKLSRCN
jgi:hypothetical protein